MNNHRFLLLIMVLLNSCAGVVYDIGGRSPYMSAAFLAQSSQSSSVTSLPVTFDLTFDQSIDTSSFTVQDLSNMGSAPGTTWTIFNTGDDMHFTVRATATSGSGTIIPYIEIGLVRASSGRVNGTVTGPSIVYTRPAAENPAAFVTKWKTDNLGSANNQIVLPLVASASYNFDVDWGDGSESEVTAWNDPDATHTYASIGTYTVAIVGTFGQIYFDHGGDKLKILEVLNWGDIQWSSMFKAFAGCENLQVTANDSSDLSNVTDMRLMFSYAVSFNGNLESWDLSNVTNTRFMFFYAQAFDADISGWDVRNVTAMDNMFDSATAFNIDLSGWNVGAVTTNNSFDFGTTSWVLPKPVF